MERPKKARRTRRGVKTAEGTLESHLRELATKLHMDQMSAKILEVSKDGAEELDGDITFFVALAISKTGDTNGSKRDTIILGLMNYINVLSLHGLPINDIHDERTALEWASYYGFGHVIQTLLERGCSLVNPITRTNPIYWAIKNAQKDSVDKILYICGENARIAVLQEGECVEEPNIDFFSSLFALINSGNDEIAQVLKKTIVS